MNIKKAIKETVKYIWQLPQNLCGLFYLLINKNNRVNKVQNDLAEKLGASVHLQVARGGVTLGRYIFIWKDETELVEVIKHECGHVKQSLILGPLYLLVIGIPSILHASLNGLFGCCRKHKEGYYHFYTEHILMGDFDMR